MAMRFIPPSSPPNTKSSAEKNLFEVLQKMLGWDDWICFHSLRLDKHSYQTCGEIDFVLLGPEGFLAIEVKGGRVSVSDGEFSHENRFGRVNRDTRGPYRQVEDAVYSLWDDLGQRGSVRDFLKFVNHGWIVAFPDIQFDSETVEHDPKLTVDTTSCKDSLALDAALKEAISYWKSKKSRFRILEKREIDALTLLIRPSFDKVPSLRHLSAEHRAISVELTDNQYAILDAAKENPRIFCTGGAGTGKSFIALEAARQKRNAGQSVLFTSKNGNLLTFLRHQPDLEDISFQPWDTAEGLFDFVIVDEAQDCLTESSSTFLSQRLGCDWTLGSWLLCLDPNGQADVGAQIHRSTLGLFKRHAVNLNLSINCRNTGVILAQTKWATNADVGVTGTGQGPAVSWCQANDASAEAAALAEHLENLLGNEGLGLSDITILDMGDGINTINRLPDSWKSKISPLTNSVVLNWPNRPITLARIANFKGLENTAVCIVGARDISSLTAPINYLYVAMTRALSHLWIGTSVELGRLVEQGLGTDAEVNRARWSN
jgi:hypothetical protein